MEVTSSHKWILTNDSDWITTSADEGESGSLVEISAGHNTSADIKSGEIIFTCGDKTAVLKVSQEIDGNRTIQFKDPNFLEALIAENVDDDGDGQISFDEAKAVKSLDVTDSDIKEMSEIRYFTELKSYLYCDNNQLTYLDISKNSALEELWCNNNPLTYLDVSNNTALKYLVCYNNPLTTLDVCNNTALTVLNCGNNQLTTLDVSNNAALTGLNCDGNQLTTLDVSNNTALTALWCYDNQLTTLDVSNNTALTELYCVNNQLTDLDVSNNTALKNLNCYGNPLQSVTISESQINASWMDNVKNWYPDIEIIVK